MRSAKYETAISGAFSARGQRSYGSMDILAWQYTTRHSYTSNKLEVVNIGPVLFEIRVRTYRMQRHTDGCTDRRRLFYIQLRLI